MLWATLVFLSANPQMANAKSFCFLPYNTATTREILRKKTKLSPRKPINYTSLISDCVTEAKSNTSGDGGPLCTLSTLDLKFCISCEKELWEQPWSAITACRCAAFVVYLQCNFWAVTEKKKLLFPLPIHALIYKNTLLGRADSFPDLTTQQKARILHSW